jgi:hypothetical protein
MQFMGNMELCTQVGSERWFVPLTTGGWNASTRRGVTTGNNASPREGVLLAYGRAFGNAANGMVMYEAGHDLTGGGGGAANPHKVSAQRAYFNFLLLAGKERKLNIVSNFPGTVASGLSYPVSATTTSGTAPFTYQWQSNLNGTFANPVDSSTSYTAPFVSKDTFDVIKVTVTDQCGKKTFDYRYIPLTVMPLPVALLSFTGSMLIDTAILRWTTASEINNDFFSLSKSIDGELFYEIGRVKGNGTSSVQNSYEFIDSNPPKGMVYYRLSQTDHDGKVHVFKPIVLNNKGTYNSLKNAEIYPNPFQDKFSITVYSEQQKTMFFSFMTLKGDIIQTKQHQAIKGRNEITFEVPNHIASGIYVIGMKSDNEFFLTRKIIKK